MGPKTAITAIEKKGLLLVYPVNNAPDPESIWSVAYPRSPMSWEWDEAGDDRVARLWHLRAELSVSRKVIYTKWYQGRATFLSRPIFRGLYRLLLENPPPLSRDARTLLASLRESSPRSTRELKKESGLQGRLLESTYARAMKELWTRLEIVGFGEVDEGSFPSLAVGASGLLFESDVDEARSMSIAQAHEALRPIAHSPRVQKFLRRVLAQSEGAKLPLR